STYRVVVTNSVGSVTSNSATLTVNATTGSPQLVGFLPGVGTAKGVVVDPLHNLAYVASQEFGLSAVDVLNPMAPTAVDSADQPFFGTAVAVAGTRAVVLGLDAGQPSLRALDLTAPAAPRAPGGLAT